MSTVERQEDRLMSTSLEPGGELLVVLGIEDIKGQAGAGADMGSTGELYSVDNHALGSFSGSFQPSIAFAQAIQRGIDSLEAFVTPMPSDPSPPDKPHGIVTIPVIAELRVDFALTGLGPVHVSSEVRAAIAPLSRGRKLYFYSAAGYVERGRKHFRGLVGNICIAGARVVEPGSNGFEAASSFISKPLDAMRFASSNTRRIKNIKRSGASVARPLSPAVANKFLSEAKTVPEEVVVAGFAKEVSTLHRGDDGLYFIGHGETFDLAGHRVGHYIAAQPLSEPSLKNPSRTKGIMKVTFWFDGRGTISIAGGTVGQTLPTNRNQSMMLLAASTVILGGTGEFENIWGVHAMCASSHLSGQSLMPGSTLNVEVFYELRFVYAVGRQGDLDIPPRPLEVSSKRSKAASPGARQNIQAVLESVRRMNLRDFKGYLDDFASDFRFYVNSTSKFVDRQGALAFMNQFVEVFQGVKIHIDEIFANADGSRVTYRFTAKADGSRNFLGLPPSDKPIVFSGSTFYEFRGGVRIACWNYWDDMTILQQVKPSPGQPLASAPLAKKDAVPDLPRALVDNGLWKSETMVLGYGEGNAAMHLNTSGGELRSKYRLYYLNGRRAGDYESLVEMHGEMDLTGFIYQTIVQPGQLENPPEIPRVPLLDGGILTKYSLDGRGTFITSGAGTMRFTPLPNNSSIFQFAELAGVIGATGDFSGAPGVATLTGTSVVDDLEAFLAGKPFELKVFFEIRYVKVDPAL